MLTHGLTIAEGKGAWLANLHQFPSTMAQNFWIAIFAWTVCFVVTIVVSLATKRKSFAELKGLVWGATEMPRTGHEPWYQQPVMLAAVVGVVCILFNILFR
jgi:SSS family solute:Na+ symporter